VNKTSPELEHIGESPVSASCGTVDTQCLSNLLYWEILKGESCLLPCTRGTRAALDCRDSPAERFLMKEAERNGRIK